MKYTLLINGGPGSQSAETALDIAQALLASGHTLYRLFFYQSGVLLARRELSDAASPARRWQQLVTDTGVDAVVCISAAVRRGLISEEESRGMTPHYEAVADGFQVSGLGQLAEAMAHSNRVMSFG